MVTSRGFEGGGATQGAARQGQTRARVPYQMEERTSGADGQLGLLDLGVGLGDASDEARRARRGRGRRGGGRPRRRRRHRWRRRGAPGASH